MRDVITMRCSFDLGPGKQLVRIPASTLLEHALFVHRRMDILNEYGIRMQALVNKLYAVSQRVGKGCFTLGIHSSGSGGGGRRTN